jgi:hypothetical protein
LVRPQILARDPLRLLPEPRDRPVGRPLELIPEGDPCAVIIATEAARFDGDSLTGG